jgi:hypothetical protein
LWDWYNEHASDVAAAAGLIALATSWIPGVDVLTAGIALAAVGLSLYAAYKDVKEKKYGQAALDLTSAVGGGGGLFLKFAVKAVLVARASRLADSGEILNGVTAWNRSLQAEKVAGLSEGIGRESDSIVGGIFLKSVWCSQSGRC